MLNLTRRVGQKIFAVCPDGTTVEIVVNAIRGGWVILGIQAPDEVSISRDTPRAPARKGASGDDK